MTRQHWPNVPLWNKSHRFSEFLGQHLFSTVCVPHQTPKIFRPYHLTGLSFGHVHTGQVCARQNSWVLCASQIPHPRQHIKQDIHTPSSLARKHLGDIGWHLVSHVHQSISPFCMTCTRSLHDATIIVLWPIKSLSQPLSGCAVSQSEWFGLDK